MTYRKPEVAVLGNAGRVIQGSTEKQDIYLDGSNGEFTAVSPACDLDE